MGVGSINEDCVQRLLTETEHDLIVVGGTSIIQRHILDKGNCFVNLHAGITPEYRGAHGAIWAAINCDFSNAGVTLHFIDEGIDTGAVIAQKTIELASSDSLETVVCKQNVAGVALLNKFLAKEPSPYASAARIEVCLGQ